MDNVRFNWTDYLVFVMALGFSAFAAVVQGVMDGIKRKKMRGQEKRQGESKEVERNISVWPASLSVLASTLAAPFVIGVPAEIYTYGFHFAYLFFGLAISIPFCAHFLFARFYELKITSIYEYLEFRFNKFVRSLCSASFAISLLIYIGIITFAPAVVFSKMTGTSISSSVLGVGLLGVCYTAVGGLKGVMWVDAIQMMIILASVLAIIIKGTVKVGGATQVVDIALSDGRLELPLLSLNPFLRHTLWTQALGGSITTMVIFTNQAIVQKFIGLPTLKHVYITSYISMAACIIYFLLFVAAGLVIYAYYSTCSPILLGEVKRLDELVPVFVLEAFRDQHGISGLFTAAVFSASLSSMAGGINALATVTFLDILHPIYRKRNDYKDMPKNLALVVSKLLVIIYGLLTIGMAYLAPILGKGLLHLVLNLLGIVGAPILAVFLMGVFMPCINSKGAAVGLVSSLVTMFVISFSGLYVSTKYSIHIKSILPLSNATCQSSNQTLDTILSRDTGGEPTNIERLLLISYMWYPFIALCVAFSLGFIISWLTGFTNYEKVNEDLSYLCCYRKQTFENDSRMDEIKLNVKDECTTFRRERCSECRRSWFEISTKL